MNNTTLESVMFHANTTIGVGTTIIPTLNTTTATNAVLFSNQVTRIIFAVCMGFLSVFTVLSNIIVAMALLLDRKLRKMPASLLVTNLALADLLVGLIVMPLALVNLFGDGVWPLPRPLCRFFISLDVICCTASIVTLCAIAIDRFLAITVPFQYPFVVTGARVALTNCLIWVYSIAVLLGTLDYSQRHTNSCDVKNELYLVALSTIFSFFVPSAVIGLVYVKIWRLTRSINKELRQQEKIVAAHHRPSQEHTTSHRIRSRLNSSLHRSLSYKSADSGAIRDRDTTLTSLNTNQHKVVSRSSSSQRPGTPKQGAASTSNLQDYAECSRKLTKSEKVLGPEYVADRRKFDRKLRMHSVNSKGTLVDHIASLFYRKHHVKHANRLAAIIVTFYVCWGPFFVAYLADYYANQQVSEFMMLVFSWLGYANSALNPMVYAMTMQSYRQSFRSLCLRAFPSKMIETGGGATSVPMMNSNRC